MNYLALTIGPIYETISYAKRTRELWAGSYIFSYFMRNMIAKLIEEKNITFLLPYANSEIVKKSFEVGIFHDRFIATSTLSKDEIEKAIEKAYKGSLVILEKLISNSDKNKQFNAIQIQEALGYYLQSSYLIATEKELDSLEKDNVIFAIDAILDSMELQQSFTFENLSKIYPKKIQKKDGKTQLIYDELVNPIAQLQYEVNTLKEAIIKEYADSGLSPYLKFKSIPEIAFANGIKDQYTYIDSPENYDEVYANYTNLKPYHKYYVVINADGDSIGKLIRNTFDKNNPSSITSVSEGIYKHIVDGDHESSLPLVELFESYGGMLIYAGGDDLLGFAPLFGKNDKSVFELLETLSERFKYYLGTNVSLSFGLSIRYYKSPMIESIDNAGYLLFDKAKKHNSETQSGSISLSLTKHSGQSFDATFFLGDNTYIEYTKLLIDELNENIQLPHNIQYVLKRLEPMIIHIYQTNDYEVENKIDSLFKNMVEDSSQTEIAKTSINRVKDYMNIVKPINSIIFEKFISQLAIIKFLRGDQ